MARSHESAQKLAEVVYKRGRRIVLSTLGATIERLDALYAADAEAIQQQLQVVLQRAGVPTSEVKRIVDDVFAASRPQRIAAVEQAIQHAAVTAADTDSQTFKAVFGGDRAAAVPLAVGRSRSPRTRKHCRQLAPGSAAS